MADLELRGKAEGTTSLEILGKLNPLAKLLALDITCKVRDLELPPLSPYSVRYSGYGIERGKLSVDVNYVVQPDGRLTASNKLVLSHLHPGLRLTVVGTSGLAAEREGFKRARLDALVGAEKRRQPGKSVKAGTQKEAGGKEEMSVVTPADYPAPLKEVYQRADVPKPRNLIGLTKDQPVPETKNMLLADIPVSDDAMHALAVQCGMAVRDYLASRDLSGDRLFLGAVKAVPPEAKWTPRVELNLAMP